MREYKFRAWSEEENMMVLSKNLIENTIPTEPTSRGFRLRTNFVLMQWTGLKDKNGDEVYEGDIVNHRYGKNSKVFWHEKTASFQTLAPDNGLMDIDWLEVVGNVYENSELLEVKEDE